MNALHLPRNHQPKPGCWCIVHSEEASLVFSDYVGLFSLNIRYLKHSATRGSRLLFARDALGLSTYAQQASYSLAQTSKLCAHFVLMSRAELLTPTSLLGCQQRVRSFTLYLGVSQGTKR